MKINLYRIIIIFITIILNISLPAQNDSTKFVTVIPGPEYEAGKLHRLIFGDHWRDLWTEPVKVPVLDLDNFAGGLKPYEIGGGLQTLSLKFYGADGQRWKFRSINKDPSKLLPEEFHKTFVESVLHDQTSSANPFAAIVASELLNAVGIMQAVPEMYVMPDDPKLGEYRDIFACMLGTIEVHPDEAGQYGKGFVDTEKIKGTFKLLEDLEEKRNDKVDPVEFLKARLMDVLIGDWDRHADQWRWAKFEEGRWDWWRPIPRDRDQAFAKYDGLGPKVFEYLVPQLTSFNYDYPDIEDLTWNGRHIDKRFLTELSKVRWDSVTVFIQNKITDSVIVSAVKKLPEEHFKIGGKELINKLMHRRDKLSDISQMYYKLVNKVAYVYGTHKEDFILVDRIDDSLTSVEIYEYEDEWDVYHGVPYFSKVFENDITKEIRIYMLDDADKAVVKGSVNCSPLVRIIGGKGKDIFIDSSKVRGYFLTVTPIPDSENKTFFYDDEDNTIVYEGAGTKYDNSIFEERTEDIVEKFEPSQISYGHNWLVLPLGGYSTENGIKLGASLNLFSYDFRKAPYEYRQQVNFLYASKPNSYSIEYVGKFPNLVRNIDFDLRAAKSELDFTRYYGFGNEAPFDEELQDNDYYRLEQEYITIHPQVKIHLNGKTSLLLGAFYEFHESYLNSPSLLNMFRYSDFGTGAIHSFGLNAGFRIDKRDNIIMPRKGFLFELKGRYYFPGADIEDDYFKSGFDIRTYSSFKLFSQSTLMLRAGGGKVMGGKYPFYDAVFLGGENNLRGFSSERFSGDASIFTQAVLRSNLTELKIIIKGKFGIDLFAETGRVFTENSNSKKWHNSIGGGFWISYLEDTLIVSLSAAFAPDEKNFYLDTATAF